MADKAAAFNENAIKIATESVDDLYHFRDHYFENHSIEDAIHKVEKIEAKLKSTLMCLTDNEGNIQNKALYLMLRGKALNVTADFNSEALECLTKSVKLDPKLVQAWIHLGECYWKKKDVNAAKNCFLGALNHSKDKVALRNLSMVLRQGQCQSSEEKVKLIEESVEKAKEALSLDIKDGTSWFVLGNAYLSQFFASNQDPKLLKQCMSAYHHAEQHIVTSNNADLHFNRATAYKYQEQYQLALNGFAKAAALDPAWEEPKTMERNMVQYLTVLQEMVATKGKQKPKKLQTLIDSIKDGDLGPYGGGSYTNQRGKTITLKQSLFAELKAGLNVETVVVGKVVCSVKSDEPVPFTFCMVDRNSTCYAVTLYNIATGGGVKIGDSVAIPEPFVEEINFTYQDKCFQVQSIRVASPVVLVVNGRKLGLDKQAAIVLSASVFA